MNRNFHDSETLLKSLAENDIRAVSFLYTESREKLFLIAHLILKDQEAAKDIVHDLFTDFWENRYFENIVSLRTFLVRSVRNKAINYKRRQAVLSGIKNALAGNQDFQAPSIENEELRQELQEAMDKLSPMESKVFAMHYIEHQSYDDISDKLGITKSTISNHLVRGLKKLRAELKKNR